MVTVTEQIQNADEAICRNIESLADQRALLSRNVLSQLRNSVEGVAVDLDPSLREYHEKITTRVEAVRSTPLGNDRDRYYIHRTRPFFVGRRVYYEVTFYRAINKVSKFDRIIAFTDIDMTDKYAAKLTLQRDSIEVLGQIMPITIIRGVGGIDPSM